MYQKIKRLSEDLQEKSVARRRDFHKYAETGWLEMRTSSLIARALKDLGYQVLAGKEVCLETSRLGLPTDEKLISHYQLAGKQGADPEFLPYTKDGYTGVIGILKCGEGPVVALRFDIDALCLIENQTDSHRPTREGFASVNHGMMHGCGHDGHAVIGMGVAEVLSQIRDQLHGTVKLIFEPGEEGSRGAKAIVDHGHLDDVDYLVASHIAPDNGPDDGDITPGTYGALPTTKYDAYFHGRTAHAGGYPEKGNNALLAAANAVLNIAAIPRHSGGITRVNVGTLEGGTGRNVIPNEAKMQLEVCAETEDINTYLEEYALRVCRTSAEMHGCTCDIIKMGMAASQHSDVAFIERICRMVKKEIPEFRISSCENALNWGSEDISLMMNRVQEHGGQATYMRMMTKTASLQHTTEFDFDESVLSRSILAFSAITYDLLK